MYNICSFVIFGLQRYGSLSASPIPKNSEIAQKQAFGAIGKEENT